MFSVTLFIFSEEAEMVLEGLSGSQSGDVQGQMTAAPRSLASHGAPSQCVDPGHFVLVQDSLKPSCSQNLPRLL